MLSVTIEQAGKDDAFRRLDALASALRDLSDMWPDVRDEFFTIEQEMFDSEGASNASGGWEPLSAHYAAWKDANFGTPILQRTGTLMASLTSDAADVVMTADSLTVGTSIPYAGYHQYGTSRMPARPVIDLSPANQERLIDRARQWVDSRVLEAAA